MHSLGFVAILPLIPIITGVLTTIYGGTNLYFAHFRKVNSFAELRKQLEDIANIPQEKDDRDTTTLIEFWLPRAEVIFIPLKQRLISRFLCIFLAAVGTSLTAYLATRSTTIGHTEI